MSVVLGSLSDEASGNSREGQESSSNKCRDRQQLEVVEVVLFWSLDQVRRKVGSEQRSQQTFPGLEEILLQDLMGIEYRSLPIYRESTKSCSLTSGSREACRSRTYRR
jgi:hypothetical protein